MSIGAILGLVLPLVSKILGWVFDRFWKNGVSTVQGTVAGAAVVALLEGMGCNLSLANEALVGLVAAVPGLLATDAKVTGKTLLDAVAEAKQPLTPDGSVSHS